jgi:hypothetical protein
MQLLLESGLIGEAHSLGYEPYAAPGDISPPSTGSGVAGPRHYEGGYRRVRAAC